MRISIGKSHFTQTDESFHLLIRTDEYQRSGYIITLGDYDKEDIDLLPGEKHVQLLLKSPISLKFKIGPEEIRNNPLLFALKISHQTTYAPLNAFLAGWFINDKKSFEENLTLLRIPNIIASILVLLGVVVFLKKLSLGNIYLLLFPVTILSASLMNLIYSSQGLPYGLLVFFILLQLIFINRISDQGFFNKKNAIHATIICILAGYTHWLMQLPILIFYFTISLFIFLHVNQINKKNGFYNLIVSAIVYFIMMLPGLLLFFFKRLESAGNRHDFYSLKINLLFPLKILERYYLIIKSNFSFFQDGIFNEFVIVCCFILSLYGTYQIIKHFKSPSYLAALFSVLVIAGLTLSNIVNLFPLTTTRHTIFLIPIFLLLIFVGILHLANQSRFFAPVKLFTISITLIIMLQSFIGFKKFHNDRKLYDTNKLVIELNEYINKYDVEMIDGFNSLMVPLWIKDQFQIPVKWRSEWFPYDLKKHKSILFISCSDPRIGSDDYNFLSFINNIDSNFVVTDLKIKQGTMMDLISNNYIDPDHNPLWSDPHNSLFISVARR